MQAAILSSGPSLTTVYDESMAACFDVRIAVNAAAVLRRCDWWVAVDAAAGNTLYPSLLGRPRLLCYAADVESLSGGVKELVAMTEADLLRRHRPGSRWAVTYSSLAALLLAHDLGADRVDVYGHDMAGQGDAVDPLASTKGRHARRWEREARLWRRLVAWVGERGTRVIRHDRQPA